jgi:predicted enzyme related to lactoylglutathione lyase
MAISKIVPTLPAVNIERAKKFYANNLGCRVTREDPGPGAGLSCPGGELYLYQRAPTRADHTVISLETSDLDADMNELRDHGVKFEDYDLPGMGIKTVNGVAQMGNSRGAWFKDSEGNILSIMEPSKVTQDHRELEEAGATSWYY